MADSIIELCHMMYNHSTAKGVVEFCIKRLKERIVEYKPNKKINNIKERK